MKKFFKNLQRVNIFKALKLHRYTMPAIIMASIAVFLFSNYLLSLVSARVDLSQGQAYTLTDSSKKILHDLKKPVTISFFVSSDLPAQLQPLKREVNDLLQEYGNASGNVVIKVVDPKTDAKAKTKADDAGIKELPFQQLQQNQYQVTSAYFGLLIESGDQKEPLPQVTNVEELEYNITSAIYKMTRKELPKVAVMGYAESYMPQGDELSTLKQVLGQQFSVGTIALPPAQPPADENSYQPTPTPTPFVIDPTYKTVLVFVTPDSNFGKEQIAAMKKYMDNKGRLIVFVNGQTVDDSIQTNPTSKEFLQFLSQYGIEVKQNLVLSSAAELVNFGNQGFSLMLPYPMWLRANQFNQEASYFSNVSYLTYPWASSLVVKDTNGYKTTELVKTSEQSWAQTGTFVLDPQQIPDPKQSDLKQYVVTAESKKKDGGALMVIGSARFAVDRYVGQRSGNLEFVLNALNNYASDGALSGIRARAVSFYPLPELPKQLQSSFQYMNILLLPGIFALYGFLRLYRRGKNGSRQ